MRRLTLMKLVAASILFAAWAAAAAAEPATGPACTTRSGPATLPLVELYTSEGCSSCPPADQWLRQTFSASAVAPSAAVLAFHVDYWDRLGWRDRFGQRAFSERQYDAVRRDGGRTAYTPQVMVQGHDVGLWRSSRIVEQLRAEAMQPAVAEIEVQARASAGVLAVEADASTRAARRADLRLYVAMTDSDLASEVTAGENAGVRLVHDHVARALSPGAAFDAAGRAKLAATFTIPRERGNHPAIVAFVQDVRRGDVLQAAVLALACADR